MGYRQLTKTLLKRLDQTPAVALLGSRQVGKTAGGQNDVGKGFGLR
jgi:predicted AAA+ superfamily ATPase